MGTGFAFDRAPLLKKVRMTLSANRFPLRRVMR
jgi:hypothetical protein